MLSKVATGHCIVIDRKYCCRVERHFQHYFYRQPLDCLSYMQKKRIACDVTLQVQGQAIPCHRVILAAHSSVFHAMFEDNPEFKIVNIADISHEVLYSIVRYADFICFQPKDRT